VGFLARLVNAEEEKGIPLLRPSWRALSSKISDTSMAKNIILEPSLSPVERAWNSCFFNILLPELVQNQKVGTWLMQ